MPEIRIQVFELSLTARITIFELHEDLKLKIKDVHVNNAHSNRVVGEELLNCVVTIM